MSPKAKARAAARKTPAKRRAKATKKPALKWMKAAKPLGTVVGRVSHYFTHISVAVIELTAPLRVGDRIRVQGATTNFEQPISSMQIEHAVVQEAGAGDSVGLKVRDRVRQGDTVYRL